MVLKKLSIILCIINFSILFAQENQKKENWIKIFSGVFDNTTEVIELRNNKRLSKLNYGLQNRMWLPSFSVDFPNNMLTKRGDSIYSKNQQTSSDYYNIFASSLNLEILQRLPGHGYIQGIMGYGFDFLTNKNQFLQNPYLSISFNQPISAQMFNAFLDSEIALNKSNYSYNTLRYYQGMYEQLINFLNLLQEYDKQLAEKEYYLALEEYNKEKFNLAQEKLNGGTGSRIEKYYSEQQLLSAKHQLELVNYSILQTEKKLLLVLPLDTELSDFIKDLNNIRKDLIELFEFAEDKTTKTINQQLYENVLLQNTLQYRKDKLNYAPQIYAKLSVSPDNNLYFMYSDWYKSWRDLATSPYPIEFSLSLGLKIEFDFIGQKSVRKKEFLLNKEVINSGLKMLLEKQEKEKKIITKELVDLEKYWNESFVLLEEEQKYRKEKRYLYEENLITQEEFLQSEILFRDMFRTNVDTFWQIINRKSILFLMTDSVIEIIDKIDIFKEKKDV